MWVLDYTAHICALVNSTGRAHGEAERKGLKSLNYNFFLASPINKNFFKNILPALHKSIYELANLASQLRIVPSKFLPH